jgi:hypothetical protein
MREIPFNKDSTGSSKKRKGSFDTTKFATKDKKDITSYQSALPV